MDVIEGSCLLCSILNLVADMLCNTVFIICSLDYISPPPSFQATDFSPTSGEGRKKSEDKDSYGWLQLEAMRLFSLAVS